MTDSKGWWYDRRKKIHIPINDHAQAVVDNPKKFRLCGVSNILRVADYGNLLYWRSKIISMVSSRGFIRIRLITSGKETTLGWQFTGEPHEAFKVLKRFAKRHGIGPTAEVTFTDFGLGRTLTTFWSDFDEQKAPLKTLLQHWEKTRLGGIRVPWSEKFKKEYRKDSGKDPMPKLLKGLKPK